MGVAARGCMCDQQERSRVEVQARWGFPLVAVVERVMSFTSPAIATGVSAKLVNHVLSSMCQHHGHCTSRGVVGELPAVQLCIR